MNKLQLFFILLLFSISAQARQTELVPYRKGSLWGYSNPTKKIIIAPQFKAAGFFEGEVAVIENTDSKYALINMRGEILSKSYDFIDRFRDGMARVASNGWLGFIDKQGREMIALQYEDDHNSFFENGIALVAKNMHDGKRWGYINKKGEEVIPIKYYKLDRFYGGMAIYEHETLGMGFIDLTGKEVIKADPNNKITQALHFGNSDRTLIKRNNVVALIDKYGALLKTYKFDEIGWRYEQVIMVGKAGKWGFIDYYGNTVAPTMYDEDKWGDLPFREPVGLGVVSINGKWGVINQKNQPVVPFSYEGIEVHPNGLFSAWKNNGGDFLYGVLSLEGEVLPIKYRQVMICDNGLMFVSEDYAWELHDRNGIRIGSLTFASVNPFSEGLAGAVKSGGGNKYGYINERGEMAVAFKYDVARPFYKGLALITLKGKDGYIGKGGLEYWED